MSTEDRLRSSLARRAARIPESDGDAWQAIVDRTRRQKDPSSPLAVAAIVAIAVAVAGIGFGVWALGRNVQHPASTVIPERIAFVRSGPDDRSGVHTVDLFTVRPDGTGLRNVTGGLARDGPVDWSADGSTVAFVHQSRESGGSNPLGLHTGVYVMNADGTGMREVVACQKGYGRLPCDVRLLRLSPDGSQLAYLRFGNGLARSIQVIGTDGTRHREIACPQCGLGIGPPVWSPDGTRLAFAGDLAGIIGGDTGPPLSPLYVADVRTGMVEKLPGIATASPYPSWSPDGSRIVFLLDRRLGAGLRDLSHDIAVVNADGTGERTILDCDQSGCSGPYAPVWSPDGTRVTFINEIEGGGAEIWIIGVDGTVIRKLRPCIDGTCLSPDYVVWSPDGRQVAFQALAENGQAWDLYVIGVDGTGLHRAAEGLSGIVAWLPSTP